MIHSFNTYDHTTHSIEIVVRSGLELPGPPQAMIKRLFLPTYNEMT